MSIVTERIDGLLRIYSDRNKMLRDRNGNMVEDAWVRESTGANLDYVETEFSVPEHEEVDEEA
jgi:hypothetical protein